MVVKQRERTATIADLIAAIDRLEEKVEACNGFCEQILDEVVPLGLALDAIADDAPRTAD